MLALVVFVLAVTSIYGQHVCPSCTNSLDHNSCTGTRTCHNTHDICMVRIDTQLNNRIEYHCSNSHVCSMYASHGCDPSQGQTCYYCCTDVSSCTAQRNALFMGILGK